MDFSWLIDVDGASCEKEDAGRRSEVIYFLLMSNFVHVFLLLSITSIFNSEWQPQIIYLQV